MEHLPPPLLSFNSIVNRGCHGLGDDYFDGGDSDSDRELRDTTTMTTMTMTLPSPPMEGEMSANSTIASDVGQQATENNNQPERVGNDWDEEVQQKGGRQGGRLDDDDNDNNNDDDDNDDDNDDDEDNDNDEDEDCKTRIN
jgi:hypothetical protein